MADKGFLKYFITEPVYVIPGEDQLYVKGEKVLAADQIPNEAIQEQSKVITEPKAETPSVEPEKDKELVFKGHNIKNTLIIVDQPDHDSIAAEDEEFLKKIMSAVKLDLSDLAILNVRKNPGINITDLLIFDATKYLIFGVSNQAFLKKDYIKYQLTSESDHKQILNCADLSTIAKDASQKKLLWSALQVMFL